MLEQSRSAAENLKEKILHNILSESNISSVYLSPTDFQYLANTLNIPEFNVVLNSLLKEKYLLLKQYEMILAGTFEHFGFPDIKIFIHPLVPKGKFASFHGRLRIPEVAKMKFKELGFQNKS